LPGVNANDVDIRVEGTTLHIKGERKFEGSEKNYHQIERTYGSFARAFTLPSSVDPGSVTARYSDGLLTLTLTKREEAKPRTIKIQVAGQEPKTMTAGARTQS